MGWLDGRGMQRIGWDGRYELEKKRELVSFDCRKANITLIMHRFSANMSAELAFYWQPISMAGLTSVFRLLKVNAGMGYFWRRDMQTNYTEEYGRRGIYIGAASRLWPGNEDRAVLDLAESVAG